MAVSEMEAVLEFLRKNGFFEAESALMEDLADKGELGSFDFEKFLFPMVPLPPPVRIPARPDDAGVGGGDGERSSKASSDDQFLSLGSSTSDVCSSSDFVNPYGHGSSSTPNSETSSDRMSQFGTARAYNDFDFEMQNDLYLYDEKSDEGHFMTPCFQGPDPFLGPTEDKFVMSSETNENRASTKEEEDEVGEPIHLSFDQRGQAFKDEKKSLTDNAWSLDGNCRKETDLNGLETKNFRDVSVSNGYVSPGKDLVIRNPNNCMTSDSGKDWFSKSKPDLSSEKELLRKDLMSTEEFGEGEGEAPGEQDQEGDSRDEILMVEGLDEKEYE
ncbi:hypothetical protein CRG98_040025, partial [Punica granatum]